MITLRNTDLATSVSARAADATLVPGMVVKLVQGAASGDQPKVSKASAADLADATIQKGIVDFIQPDSQAVDFTYDVNSQGLTPIAQTIPAGAQVNVWIGKMVIAYHDSLLPAGLLSTAVREASKVAFDSTTSMPGVYNAAGANGLNVFVGTVYRVDPKEVTMIVTL